MELWNWHHHKFGAVSPSEFISISEENGLILALGEQVLRRSCLIAAAWPDDCKIAVNISPIQIKHSDLIGVVESSLAESGLAAERLELEVTESLFIEDSSSVWDVLKSLRERGISIAMDDFGTGYSSIRSLTSFPFDKVKIDRSFTTRIGQCTKTEEVLRSIFVLSERFKFDVVVEGVETLEQVEFLQDKKCWSIQGFLIGEPFDSQKLDQWSESGVQALKNIGWKSNDRGYLEPNAQCPPQYAKVS